MPSKGYEVEDGGKKEDPSQRRLWNIGVLRYNFV